MYLDKINTSYHKIVHVEFLLQNCGEHSQLIIGFEKVTDSSKLNRH